MRKLVFILSFTISISLFAQQEELPKDSIPEIKKENFKFNEKLDNYLKSDADSESKDDKNEIFNRKLPDYDLSEKNYKKSFELNLPPLDLYTGPPLENNTFSHFPFVNDYSFSSGLKLSDNSWLTSFSGHETYPTLGAIRTVDMKFNYQPLDWLVISAGPYGAKYNLGTRWFNDVGASGAVKFILHDRIRLNAYGQYSAFTDKNGVHGPLMNMYPQTYYGGTLEVKISDKFGIEGGVIRELNPFTGKWENRPYFAPVFYK